MADLGMGAGVLGRGLAGGLQAQVGVLVTAERELGAGEVDEVVGATFGWQVVGRVPRRRPFDAQRIAQFDGDGEFVDA